MHGAATAIVSPFKPSAPFHTRLRYVGLKCWLARELHFSTVVKRPLHVLTPEQGEAGSMSVTAMLCQLS